METLMATAFGQDVAVQRGEGDQVSKAADTVFRAAEEGSALSVDVLGLILCECSYCGVCVLKYFHLLKGLYNTQHKGAGKFV